MKRQTGTGHGMRHVGQDSVTVKKDISLLCMPVCVWRQGQWPSGLVCLLGSDYFWSGPSDRTGQVYSCSVVPQDRPAPNVPIFFPTYIFPHYTPPFTYHSLCFGVWKKGQDLSGGAAMGIQPQACHGVLFLLLPFLLPFPTTTPTSQFESGVTDLHTQPLLPNSALPCPYACSGDRTWCVWW